MARFRAGGAACARPATECAYSEAKGGALGSLSSARLVVGSEASAYVGSCHVHGHLVLQGRGTHDFREMQLW